MARVRIEIGEQPLDTSGCLGFVRSPGCGAVALFEGSVRQKTGGSETVWLEYECYEAMARRELERIAAEAVDAFDLAAICIQHRIGRVEVGETSLIVAVGAAHRRTAFEAVPAIVDATKRRVPIWKRDHRPDGTSAWLASHGPENPVPHRPYGAGPASSRGPA